MQLQIRLSESGITIENQTNESLTQEFISWKNSENVKQILENKFGISPLSIQKLEVEIENSSFLLIPTTYYSTLFLKRFLEISFGKNELDNMEVHSQEVEKEKSQLVFLVSSKWKDYLSFHFPLAKINYHHFIGNQLNQLSKFMRNQFHVWFTNDIAYVILRKNSKLQLVNAFEVKSAIELAFYLHSIRDTFDVNLNKETFTFYGSESLSDEFKNELLKYSIPTNSYEKS